MPGKLLKKLFKIGRKKPKTKAELKKQRDAWHASDEYKQKVRDYRLKNQEGLVIKNQGTPRETRIQVKNVQKNTKGFHANKKYDPWHKHDPKKYKLNRKNGGAVGPNGIL